MTSKVTWSIKKHKIIQINLNASKSYVRKGLYKCPKQIKTRPVFYVKYNHCTPLGTAGVKFLNNGCKYLI